MEKDELVASFFTKIPQVRDQLFSIEVAVVEDGLLQTSIDGLPSAWEKFFVAVNGREVKPNIERLWNKFLQEEG